MPCPRCCRPLVRLLLTVGNEPAILSSCSTCGTRAWQVGNEVVGLDEVLGGLRDRGLASAG